MPGQPGEGELEGRVGRAEGVHRRLQTGERIRRRFAGQDPRREAVDAGEDAAALLGEARSNLGVLVVAEELAGDALAGHVLHDDGRQPERPVLAGGVEHDRRDRQARLAGRTHCGGLVGHRARRVAARPLPLQDQRPAVELEGPRLA